MLSVALSVLRVAVYEKKGSETVTHLSREVNVTRGIDQVDEELTTFRILRHLVVGNLLLQNSLSVLAA